jgi:hypothetical protein
MKRSILALLMVALITVSGCEVWYGESWPGEGSQEASGETDPRAREGARRGSVADFPTGWEFEPSVSCELDIAAPSLGYPISALRLISILHQNQRCVTN